MVTGYGKAKLTGSGSRRDHLYWMVVDYFQWNPTITSSWLVRNWLSTSIHFILTSLRMEVSSLGWHQWVFWEMRTFGISCVKTWTKTCTIISYTLSGSQCEHYVMWSASTLRLNLRLRRTRQDDRGCFISTHMYGVQRKEREEKSFAGTKIILHIWGTTSCSLLLFRAHMRSQFVLKKVFSTYNQITLYALNLLV